MREKIRKNSPILSALGIWACVAAYGLAYPSHIDQRFLGVAFVVTGFVGIILMVITSGTSKDCKAGQVD